jgi:pimeloyl-ACP methyl ester carboxylesterase
MVSVDARVTSLTGVPVRRRREAIMTTRSGAAAVVLTAALIRLAIAPAHARAQQPVVRGLEAMECPAPATRSPLPQIQAATGIRIECGWLVVPEDHSRPDGRTIRLAVAMIRAPSPGEDPPLVVLHGGPGSSGLGGLLPMATTVAGMGRRDVVVYDQRGAGYSEPELCPEYAAVQDSARKLRDRALKEEIWDAGGRACTASLEPRGIDRAAYNTMESALDLADLRRALGYSRWDVWGVSYGSRLAQEAMVRDSAAIRAVVLELPVTRSQMQFAGVALSHQHAFERIVAACERDAACNAAFPELSAEFYSDYERLSASPMPIALSTVDSARQDTLWLDGGRLTTILPESRPPTGYEQLPLLIHELHSGDRLRAGPGTPGQVLVHLIRCYDSYGDAFLAIHDSTNTIVRPPFRSEQGEDCPMWQPRHANASDQQPIHSDIPTLILTGEFDDRTPTEHGRQIAAFLGHAWLFEYAGVGHGINLRGPLEAACYVSILQQFMREPSREPDGSCLERLRDPRPRGDSA